MRAEHRGHARVSQTRVCLGPRTTGHWAAGDSARRGGGGGRRGRGDGGGIPGRTEPAQRPERVSRERAMPRGDARGARRGRTGPARAGESRSRASARGSGRASDGRGLPSGGGAAEGAPLPAVPEQGPRTDRVALGRDGTRARDAGPRRGPRDAGPRRGPRDAGPETWAPRRGPPCEPGCPGSGSALPEGAPAGSGASGGGTRVRRAGVLRSLSEEGWVAVKDTSPGGAAGEGMGSGVEGWPAGSRGKPWGRRMPGTEPRGPGPGAAARG